MHEKFIFTYLLGTDSQTRDEIKKWAKENNFIIINIPYASGELNKVDSGYGDISLNVCSIGNWLWLIHNAEYIITDSFHGLAFSVNYNKKFVALERRSSININNRIDDFLRNVEEIDKKIPCNELDNIKNMKWDYEKINDKLNPIIKSSKNYLRKCLTD